MKKMSGLCVTSDSEIAANDNSAVALTQKVDKLRNII